MRHFPFKTLILCVLLPPFVYVFSIQFLEKSIQARYDEALAAAYTGDTRHLFDGSVRLQDAIRENVDRFMSSRKLPDWGVRVNVTVKTRDGIYLYPDAYDDPKSDLSGLDSIAIARENFRLLNDGLIKTVDVKVEQNTLISNSILLSCVIVSLLVLFLFYRRGVNKINEEERAKQEVINGLANERQKSLSQLGRLESQRILLSEKIDLMKAELDHERQKASATEDEMMDELVALEEKISENLAQQDQQLQETNNLKEKIKQFEKENEAKNRQLLKGVDAVRKRFSALYKKITIHEKAIEGFADLTEELKIKAEEVVHQLNDDPKMVQIKRKVFGKKSRETVFEVIFAYKGRLYFRNISGNRVEILVIGTKLTQNKDLAFLDKL
ncbi:MAG: hypothetical protein HGJ94_10565 [Desulfosarcina sp.]|nr:hypothetical protein [Desulfosarcina sp.]MBC2744016.1 hypothetical protein [Desulfosarcina sp.]MBC2766926.1 hypothetical protein [Desulfosarcina sp.]